MKERKLKLTELNNKGMSLVEVLVAMIILSIAGVSFLQSFSYAVRYNTMAKEKQKALTYAQSMMEAAKAYSVEELDNGKYKVFGDTGLTNTVTIDSSGLHTYVVDGLDSKYTLTMTAEPTTSDAVEAILTKDIDIVHNPNKKTDALFTQNLDEDMEALLSACWADMLASGDTNFISYLNTEVSSYLVLDPKYIDITNRTMHIIAKDESGSSVVKVETTYTFKVTDYEYSYYDAIGDLVTDKYSSASSVSFTVSKNDCFDATLGGDLSNIYFYYYPLYKNASWMLSYGWNDCESDNIVVSNYLTASPLDVYIVKQKLPGATATKQNEIDIKTQNDESYYNVGVKYDSSAGGLVTVYHNLKGSLYGLSVASDLYTPIDFADTGSVMSGGLAKKEEDVPLVYTVKVVVSNASSDVVTINGSTYFKQ